MAQNMCYYNYVEQCIDTYTAGEAELRGLGTGEYITIGMCITLY